jgi:hypothetical protein
MGMLNNQRVRVNWSLTRDLRTRQGPADPKGGLRKHHAEPGGQRTDSIHEHLGEDTSINPSGIYENLMPTEWDYNLRHTIKQMA